ncbi:hypothetical protein JQS43_24420 [Natronosporangium hydrolyticum]|uniref:Uncharacterized protein n=1 Tax=Natronosporangium hydrolyticum TaxID=2811111 RepID=A0A895YKF3_9ACTN|nr:hypothetical protein [Natronosporangium hydrolyticum]QSB14580.1 hypothetical protein JQS43_24420 [Natronosporangium hydrolyticum]
MKDTETECPHCGGPADLRGDRYRCRRGVEFERSGGRGRPCYAEWLSLRLEREAAAEIADYLRSLG